MGNADYKRGIEQATQPLYLSNEGPIYGYEVNQKLAGRRKNLLTKKVTKWINIYCNFGTVDDPAALHEFASGTLVYDTREAATCATTFKQACAYVGTYPIEIETEI